MSFRGVEAEQRSALGFYGQGIGPSSVGKKRGSVHQETIRDAVMKGTEGVNVCGHSPTSQNAAGSFVCLISFGV